MRYIFGYLSPPRVHVYASVLNEIFKKRVGFFLLSRCIVLECSEIPETEDKKK